MAWLSHSGTVTHVAELKDGEINEYDLTPEDFWASEPVAGGPDGGPPTNPETHQGRFRSQPRRNHQKARDADHAERRRGHLLPARPRRPKASIWHWMPWVLAAAGKMSELADFSNCTSRLLNSGRTTGWGGALNTPTSTLQDYCSHPAQTVLDAPPNRSANYLQAAMTDDIWIRLPLFFGDR